MLLHHFRANCLYAIPHRLGPTQRAILSKMFVTDDGADCVYIISNYRSSSKLFNPLNLCGKYSYHQLLTLKISAFFPHNVERYVQFL